MEQKILQSWLNGDLDKYADNNDEVYNILETPTQTKTNTELYDLGFNDCLKILRLINNKRIELDMLGFNYKYIEGIETWLYRNQQEAKNLEDYLKDIVVFRNELGESYITGYYDCLSAWNYKDETCSYLLGRIISRKPIVNPGDITEALSKETTGEILKAVEEAKQKFLDVIKKLET